MKELDPMVFVAVFQEMLGVWLWVIVLSVAVGMVALVLLLARAFAVLRVRWPASMALAPAYVVGSLGAFWTIQRVVLMVAAR